MKVKTSVIYAQAINARIQRLSKSGRDDFQSLVSKLEEGKNLDEEIPIDNTTVSITRLFSHSQDKYNVILRRTYHTWGCQIEILNLLTPEEIRQKEYEDTRKVINRVTSPLWNKFLQGLETTTRWFSNGQKLGSLIIFIVLIAGLISTCQKNTPQIPTAKPLDTETPLQP
jgi:hypothetical protein